MKGARQHLEAWRQAGFRCRMDWGRRGAREAARRGDGLVVVDTLRFSTTAAMIASRGSFVYPCLWDEKIEEFHAGLGANTLPLPQSRQERRIALSPLTYRDLAPGTHVVLASPNGATCSRYAGESAFVIAASLVNASAASDRVATLLNKNVVQSVTVLACGERWEDGGEDGDLRFALEDYLGVGAILASLQTRLEGGLSPEAQVCAGAFSSVQTQTESVLWESASGRELREKGLADDVRYCAQCDVLSAVPILRNGRLEAL